MTQEGIENKAEELFGQNSSQDYYKFWVKGANFVNSKQPYSPKDMIEFSEWCADHYIKDRKEWSAWLGNNEIVQNTNELLKLWEESK